MKYMIACDNHLAACCRKTEGTESAVIVRSLKNIPPLRRKKCEYKPCGTLAVWRLAYTDPIGAYNTVVKYDQRDGNH